MSSKKSERRAEDRKKIDLLVNRFLNGYPYLCRATDISRTGIRLAKMREPSTAPRFMGLQFQLPGTEQIITASGEAVFDDDGGTVGVRFTGLPQASAAVIERYLASSHGRGNA